MSRRDDFRRRSHDAISLATRDREIAVLRRLWSVLPLPRRAQLVGALWALDDVRLLVNDLTAGLLCVGAVETDVICARQLRECDPGAEAPALDAIASLARDAFFGPSEVICMFSCWDAGEDYVPIEPVYDHPRWPDTATTVRFRKLMQECDSGDFMPGGEG